MITIFINLTKISLKPQPFPFDQLHKIRNSLQKIIAYSPLVLRQSQRKSSLN
ncbi:hypothetical protein F544_21990 [Bibersteinia trehalosi USDA-ARS-USMARC-190]|uniref:Uncharacterized protein n=1 Tax=Bibersteinia trehalosi USDA-ARS-USMARC-190 TaxID=1263832 RepID=W0RAE5_BIBTR|nr:hypothetical protein F544_21990 [Bibersteinia trehalosi USDA-ARS-USMARC-190]